MEKNGESADKSVPPAVNAENSTKNVETSNELVEEILDEIRDAAVTESAADNAVKESLDAAVSPPPYLKHKQLGYNPRAYMFLGKEEPERKYSFEFRENDKSKIMCVQTYVHSLHSSYRTIIVGCAFNQNSTLMVTISKYGFVYAFDLVKQHYWRLYELEKNVVVITPWLEKNNHFLIGKRKGEIALLDLDKSNSIINRRKLNTDEDIKSILVPTHAIKQKHLVLVQVAYDAYLFDMDEFDATHRLTFQNRESLLKFSCYLPKSDNILSCFKTDALHVWCGSTLQPVRVIHPIKMRDRKLRMQGSAAITADFALYQQNRGGNGIFDVGCKVYNYSDGLIIAYCFHADNGILCLSTLDGYLLLINTYTFQLQHICRLKGFILTNCVFLNQPKELLICGVTDKPGRVVIFNCLNKDIQLVIQEKLAEQLAISPDGKLLAVFDMLGEINLWSVCEIYNTLKSQEECLRLLKLSFRQNKPVLVGPPRRSKSAVAAQEESLNEDIRNLLSRDRLLSILREFRWFPCKYRVLIWCALLQLPYNRCQFYQLLKMGIPPLVKQRANKLDIRNGTLKNALIRIWSCLAHWCPLFAHCKFLPQLIFPFVKLLPRHSLVVFEICVTLLTNHFQLWFAFHPLEPKNYLGLCENILQSELPTLCTFYASMHVNPEHYAWPLLSTAFSEVFTQADWLRLWDNILISPPYYPIFIVVAYNILLSDVITRLPDKPTILAFFHEQNPIDMNRVISKANSIMRHCAKTLHPERYMPDLQCIPKKVYPKFLNYPREWLDKHEKDMAAVQKEKQSIDVSIRQLELEEMKLMERLQSGLRREEHAKQIKKMEQLYRDSLRREEERLACQRQMLAVYQKELRNRKAEVAAQVQESEQRQRALQMEKDLELLMQSIESERTRNDADLLMAEEELRNQEMELLVQKSLTATGACSLRTKYSKDIKKLSNERRELKQQVNELMHIQKPASSSKQNQNQSKNLYTIEEKIDEIQREFNEILNSKD